MQFILKLLRKILESLKDYYTSSQFDELSGVKVGKDSFNEAISSEAEARASADEALESEISSAVSNQTALENVARWQGYANAMQSMVDEETAAQIAEEFEKATVEYLKDPTATKSWITEVDKDGNVITTNPYYETPPDGILIDFNVSVARGIVSPSGDGNNIPGFSKSVNKFVYLPNVSNCSFLFFGASDFNSPVIFPDAVNCRSLLNKAVSFSSFIHAPKAIECGYLLYMTNYNMDLCLPMAEGCMGMVKENRVFNSRVTLPKAYDCNNMLMNSTSFNQPLDLPEAHLCHYMLYGATSFNQPLSLPKSTNCSYMLYGAKSFNSELHLPLAASCPYMLYNATSFNQPLSLPKSISCISLLSGATVFNQPLDLPKASDCASLLRNARAFNQPLNLPECTNAYFLLNTATSFNNPVYLPKVKNAAGAFTNTKMSAENIAITFRSFPVFSAEGSSSARSTITILSTPGSAHTDTTESFTVTDDEGTEYTMDNCPVFTNDDENQTLRKEFVLITVKKGWTVEL